MRQKQEKEQTNAGKAVTKIAVIVIWLALWQLAHIIVGKEVLIPAPLGVILRLFELSGDFSFWSTTFSSLLRIMMGFFWGLVAGTILAVLTSVFPIMKTFFDPVISTIKSTPVASFIILALVWVKSGMLAPFISFLMVLPMVWSNISSGIKNTDRKLLDMAKVYRFSVWKKIRLIYIPSVLPYFVSSATTGLGFSWKAGIAAEVIAIPAHSIGRQLYNSKIYLQMTDLFAWTIVVIIMSMVIENLFLKGISAVMRKTLHTKGGRV
jgi:NitT/TauT family transport system permease protein